MKSQNQEPCPEIDAIALGIERFAVISSEMIALLENLKREINRSAFELQDAQAAVDAGKRELEALCEIEREKSSLERHIEDFQRQKDSLERAIVDQQNAWEELKTTRAREERGYEENLKNLRQREEEEHRLIWENERMTARQKLEEERSAMRQKSAAIRDVEGKDLQAREVALNKKEQELALLMQELEKIMSGLTGRIGPVAQAVPDAPGTAKSGFGQGKPVFFGEHDETGGGFNPDNALMWENAGEKQSA